LSTKSIISEDYLDTTKRLHRDKQPRDGARTALVIGVNKGQWNIGAGIASALRSAHFKVFEYDERSMDITDPDGLHVQLDHIHPVDTVVCCAGYTNLDWIEDQTTYDIAQTVNVNLVGPMILTNKFVNLTMHDDWLKYLVFIGSMAHRSVLNASAPYCASKAGLAHFIRCAGWELTPKGYRVFGVHPSNTEGTPMTEKTIDGIMNYRGITREEAEDYWGAINLMPRWLLPSDIGEVVNWLVSGHADFMSGSQIELPGGQR
jgi:NAD(P)-dependent dehydrogenase (short-subunit alcohol dehydrogenase family)